MSLGIDFAGYVKQLSSLGLPIEAATSEALIGYRQNFELFSALTNLLVQQGNFGGVSPLVIAAAGNESRRPNFTIGCAPAVSQGIISVGALGKVDNELQVAAFSNTSPDIAAPGVNIESADCYR